MYVQGSLGTGSTVKRVSNMNGRQREGVKMVVMNSHEHIRERDQRGSLPNTGGKEEE